MFNFDKLYIISRGMEGCAVKKWFKNIEEIISCFFIMITVVVVIMNVILRYGFNVGLYWAEEVATTSFVWSVFIGASACYKRNMHIGIDMIKELFPVKAQRIIDLIVHFLLLLINGYITYLSFIFIQQSAEKRTAVLGMPASYVSASLLIGFGLMGIHSLIFIINDLKGQESNVQQF